MRSQAGHRLHAARVAAIAAVIVLACYLIAVVVLNIFVVQRLTSQTDVRLSERLVDAQKEVVHNATGGSLPVEHDHDVDDAPAFVWLVSPNGATTSLTRAAPSSIENSVWVCRWVNDEPTTTSRAGVVHRHCGRTCGEVTAV